ncbi:MAG TPA: TAT-variant-translocated molybdopterin oxidoreductase [Tepidisphaeraceae bacterium]|jgi:molybdopterin-containing oxidoreductase family iron-sulfur binding subunit|nr:TAT-variant-translocated molybdopterin oxidoreductase [Tepidisphaeraceae bacterium]
MPGDQSIFDHLPSAAQDRAASAPSAPRYWRSLEELAGDETFAARIGDEFAEGADEWLDPTTRRNFLRLMGASLALGGVVGCSDFPEEKILPYVNQPESVIPGVPSFYATTVPFCGFAIGALAESHEGRPTKIEGNPDHPASLGASNIFMQASVLDLYDPDRSKLVTDAGAASTWGSFLDTLQPRLDRMRDSGKGLRFLTRTVTSPTIAAQMEELRKRYPQSRWHVHDPTANAGCSARQGGAPGRAVYDFSKADVILSLDADFVFSDVGSLVYARQFADGRRREPGASAADHVMNRLYVIESTFTLTGSMADHRRALRPGEIPATARAIAARLGVAEAAGSTSFGNLDSFLDALADDLKSPRDFSGKLRNGGVGVVVAGDHLPLAVQQLAYAMNQKLGSVGKAVRYIDPVDVQGAHSIESLTADMAAGLVDTLLILGGNPCYDSPADVRFTEQLGRLSTAVDSTGHPANFTAHLASHEDETSFYCQWHIPELHYLEAWGDARAFDGTASIIQPLILPISAASRSTPEVLEAILGRRDRGGYEIVRAYWESQWKPVNSDQTPQTQEAQATRPTTQPHGADPFEVRWQLALRQGFIQDSAFTPRDPGGAIPAFGPAPVVGGSHEDWDLVFRPDMGLWDGQYANNPWLQELPRPFTKLVWDNAALISYRSAGKLGISDGDVIRVTSDNRTLDVPAVILPGLPDQTLTLTLGYGRVRGGHVANEGGDVVRGYNAYTLRTSTSAAFAAGAKVTVLTGERRKLVMTRSHHAMANLPGMVVGGEEGPLKPDAIEHPGTSESEIEIKNRRIVRSGTHDDFRRDQDWVTKLGGENEMRAKGLSRDYPGRKIHLTIYPDKDNGGWDYSKGYQWGMSIDQTSCIGCNACVVACQAENNIPVVGKDECAREREMHWIRIDDWFGSQPGGSHDDATDEPQVIHMPVPCQHCENAPCELVCPVGATTHSVEGLNEMTYNRCIGTRYCSNNCPYKVRRFNFFLFADYSTPTRALQYNPDVTVRSRGVMEKCSYCVQRLNRTRMDIEKMTVRLEDRAGALESESPRKAAALRDEIITRQKEMLAQLQTACQQACPTQAIWFGDKNDPASHIAKLKEDKLNYTLLDDLTTQPRTSYMARLNNPNPSLSKTKRPT